jgi:glycerol-3-phosphate acyltransferase PlsY
LSPSPPGTCRALYHRHTSSAAGKGVDLRAEGDGHISATAVYRYAGRLPFLVVFIMDAGKAALAVYLAGLLTDYRAMVVFAAYAVIIGHCWSVFLRLKGGLGAIVSFAALAMLGWREFLIAGVIVGVLTLVTRKSSYSTYVLMAVAMAAFLVERQELVVILFPPGLVLLQLIKRLQIRRSGSTSPYKNELFNDLKRVR